MRAMLSIGLLLLSGCSIQGFERTQESGVTIEISRDYYSIRDDTEKLIMKHEGYRSKPYPDANGIAIGYGTNLTTRGLTESEALFLMRNDIDRIEKELPKLSGAVETLSHGRYSVLVSMAYNLGISGLSRFNGLLRAIEAGNWSLAADHMRMSRWCAQVGSRCRELAAIMERGYI